jgi:hypothetical protein
MACSTHISQLCYVYFTIGDAILSGQLLLHAALIIGGRKKLFKIPELLYCHIVLTLEVSLLTGPSQFLDVWITYILFSLFIVSIFFL